MATATGMLASPFGSQVNAVLELLLKGEKLTHLTAHHLVGTISLQYHIWKLRQEGYPIFTSMKESPDGRKYAEYRLDMNAYKQKVSFGLL